MKTLQELLDLRFGDIGAVPETLAGNEAIRRLAGRGVVRRFKPEPLPVAVLDTLAAVALSSPSKSDLQQRDILIVEDAAIRARINALLKDQDWLPPCPHLLVFLGNNRRQRQVHAWRGHAFANDHLDAFFNATVDAAIALEAFVAAAEAAGLGCCPISVIRNHAEQVSGLLGLPDHVFHTARRRVTSSRGHVAYAYPGRFNSVVRKGSRLAIDSTVSRRKLRRAGVEAGPCRFGVAHRRRSIQHSGQRRQRL